MAKGVNLLADPSAIGDDEVVTGQNVIFRKPGIIGLRPGLSFIRNLVLSSATTPPSNFVGTPVTFTWLDSLGADREMVMVYVDTDGVTRLVAAPNPDAFADIPDLGALASQPSLFRWQNTVYCFTGNDSGWVVTPDGFGSYATAPFVVGGSGNTNIKPRFAAIVGSRLVIANLGPGLENVVAFSDINDPLTFGNDLWNYGNSLSFPLAEFNGAPITGLASISTEAAGSPAQAATYVWTRKNVYQLLGEPAETDEFALPGIAPTGSLQVNKINVDAGCVSHATVVTTPYGAFWAGENDVWFMRTGSIPVAVGTKIRPALKDSPPGLMWKWHAVYEDGFYKLAIFAAGQGPTEFSPCNAQWWLDCREGAPQGFQDARWFGPMVFKPSSAADAATQQGTYCMQLDNRPGYETRAYALAPWQIAGTSSNGNAVTKKGISLCAFTEGNFRDTVAPQMEARQWQASTLYGAGDLIVPMGHKSQLINSDRGCYWVVTTGGTSGASEPTWSSAIDTVSDGSVVWTTFYFSLANLQEPAYEPKTLQIGNEIIPLILSKDALAGTGFEALNDGAEISYWISEAQRVVTQLLPDLETNTRTLYKQDGNELDADVVADFTATRNWRSRMLPPSTTRRSVGGSAQLSLTLSPGVLITSDLTWTVQFEDGAQYALTLGEGWYEQVSEVAVVLLSALSGLSAETCSPIGGWGFSDQVGVCGMDCSTRDQWAPFIVKNDGWNGLYPSAPTLTTAQLENNRRIAALLGYPTDVTTATLTGDPLYATNDVYRTVYGDFQLSMFRHRIASFGRGPV